MEIEEGQQVPKGTMASQEAQKQWEGSKHPVLLSSWKVGMVNQKSPGKKLSRRPQERQKGVLQTNIIHCLVGITFPLGTPGEMPLRMIY